MKKTLPVLCETVFLNGIGVEYTWIQKPIKNVNLRVRANGTVTISSPVGMPRELVLDFLHAHADFILSALDRFEKRRAEVPQTIAFQTGEMLPLWGKPSPIRVCRGGRTGGKLTDKELILTVTSPENDAQRRRAAALWAKNELEKQVLHSCERAKADFALFGIPDPKIKFRSMRARWGSCNTKKAVLTFNLSLICAPKEAVEYVVYHEFAHLIHPNHSADFYALVEHFLPDWKVRKAMLREIPCALFAK